MPNKNIVKVNSLNDISMLFVRAYVIPLVSIIIILLIVFMILVPYYSKITSDYPTLQSKTSQYDSMVNRISILSKAIKSKKSLDKSITDLGSILPDKPQNANIVNQFQSIIKKDNLVFTTAQAVTSTTSLDNNLNGTDNHIQSTSINFAITGSSDNAKLLFSDIMAMKPLANINRVNISNTLDNKDGNITFTVSLLALDSTYLMKKVDILKGPISVAYSEDYISKL